MKSQNRVLVAIAILICLESPGRTAIADDNSAVVFDGPAPQVSEHDLNIDYDVQPSNEKFFVSLPANYDEQTPFGLVVFTDSEDTFDHLPLGWSTALKDHKLVFIAAQNAGNDQGIARRLGLAVLGATEMMQRHKIDPTRVYAAGFSGGARMSGFLGFFQPTIFRGTVQICGADFYEAVPKVAKQTAEVPPGDYGVFSATADEIAAAKTVRFTFITGENDFRYADIQDVFHGGFEKSSFSAKLIDIPGMRHAYCSGSAFNSALTFLDQTPPLPPPAVVSANPTTLPAGPTISLTSGSHTVIVPLPDGFSEMSYSTPDHRAIGFDSPAGAVVLHLRIADKQMLPDFAAITLQHWGDDYVKRIIDRSGDSLAVKPELKQDPRFLFLMHFQKRESPAQQSPVVLQDANIRLSHIGDVVVYSELDVIGPDPAVMQDKADQALAALLNAQMLAPVAPVVVERDTSWFSPDPSKWPQILMNNYFGPPSSRVSAGSSFLMQLPDGAVVAVTARHVLGDKPQLGDPEVMDPTWTMWPPNAPSKKLTLRKLAMRLDQSKDLDCVLSTADTMQPWPVEVMTPRASSVELDEPVYVIGISRDPSASQAIHKGTVTGRDEAHSQFTYNFDTDVDTHAFSGAPIVDAHGQLIGIHLGVVQDAARNRYALNIAAALSVAVTPPAVATPVAVTATAPASPIKSADEENHTAVDALQFADSYVAAGLYDKARERLQNIITKYPTTPAAAQAKQRLKDIEGK